jgi:hypothetical protein
MLIHTRLRRTCCISSRMKMIGGFSAPPNGFRFSHPSKMSSQKQETPRYSLSGTTHINTDVENPLSDLDLQQAIDLRTVAERTSIGKLGRDR